MFDSNFGRLLRDTSSEIHHRDNSVKVLRILQLTITSVEEVFKYDELIG